MRLCFGSYLSVLVSGKAENVDNKHICEALFHSVVPNYEFTFKGQENPDRVRDDATSKLLRCVQNVSPDISNAARSANHDYVVEYFRDKVITLLDENLHKNIILALRNIIANDPQVQIGKKVVGIHDDTRVDMVNRIRKKDLIKQSDFCLYAFLAGVFLFAVDRNNRSGKDTIKSVNKDYVLSFTDYINEITLIDEYIKPPTHYIAEGAELVPNYKVEFANEVAGIVAEKIETLAIYTQPDKSLLVTLLVEANGKCLKCGAELGIPLKGVVPTNNCEIVYLRLFPSDLDNYDNAVALCKTTCCPLVSIMTIEEKTSLLNDKRRLADSLILLDEVSGIRIAKEIEDVLREVDRIKNVEGLAEIDITELVDINRKIYEVSLREVINARMKRLFRTVNEICGRLEQEISFDTDKFGSAMKFVLETLESEVQKNTAIQDPQEYVVSILVEKLYSQIGQKYKIACEIIVAYLVKRCDLFNEITK